MILLYLRLDLQHMIEQRLQTAISKLEELCMKTGFQFSQSKTVSLHVCRKRHCPRIAPNLTLHNSPITNVPQYKYLGVIFDQAATWKPHTTQLKVKCTKTLDLLKHISHKTWGADRKSLRLYIMLLKPKIDYGSDVYTSAAESYLKTVYAIKHSAIRIATGACRSSPVNSLHSDSSGIKPYKYYNEVKMLKYNIRIVSNQSHSLYYLTSGEHAHSPKTYGLRCSNLLEEYAIEFNILPEIVPEVHLGRTFP